MRSTLFTLIASSFLGVLAVAGLTACPSFAEENGIDFWNIGNYQRQLESSKRERGLMEIESESTFRRIQVKEEIVKDLLGGRIAFNEAVERFVDANRTLSAPTVYIRQYPGKTEQERASWQLIAYLRTGRAEENRSMADEMECTLISQTMQN